MFADTDSLIYEIKTSDVYDHFSSNKKMFGFINYLTNSKYHNSLNKLVIAKMIGEIAAVEIK